MIEVSSLVEIYHPVSVFWHLYGMLFCLLDVTYRFEVVQDQEQTLEMTQEYDEEEDDTSITKST